jgi:ubiquinone/menaquinone biosynthesis C-methylase UbiE
LEIGYGPGIGIQMVAKICPTCTIHGIDFSKLMYKRAVNFNKQYIDNGRVQLQYGDFLKTSVLDNNYDQVFCLNVVYFWDELNSPFKKVSSLLKKVVRSIFIWLIKIPWLKRKHRIVCLTNIP